MSRFSSVLETLRAFRRTSASPQKDLHIHRELLEEAQYPGLTSLHGLVDTTNFHSQNNSGASSRRPSFVCGDAEERAHATLCFDDTLPAAVTQDATESETEEMAFFEEMCSSQCQARKLQARQFFCLDDDASVLAGSPRKQDDIQRPVLCDAVGRKINSAKTRDGGWTPELPITGRRRGSLNSASSLKVSSSILESGAEESGVGIIFRKIQQGDQGRSQLRVIALAKGGPAAASGEVKIGMNLKKIDNVDVDGMDLRSIAPYILGATGTQVTLTLDDPDEDECANHFKTSILTRQHISDASGSKRFLQRGASKSGMNLRT